MPFVAPEVIESRRLQIRLFVESDLPALLEVNSDEEVTALLPYARWASLADADAWFKRMSAIQATGLALQFVVVSRSIGNAIGTCLLFGFEEGSARAELGYVLGRNFWGQGLMQEALEALLGCAFGSMGLRRLEAEVDTRNFRSALLLRRLGFSREGLLRQRWFSKGEARDVEMYGLLRSEWPPQRRARKGLMGSGISQEVEEALRGDGARRPGRSELQTPQNAHEPRCRARRAH